jgi:pyrimidine deaminase RibD-like protein
MDSEVLQCARTLFENRFEAEIRPAHNNRLWETKTKFSLGSQLPFSGMDAQRLIVVEVQFAKEAATAQAECLVVAIRTAGLRFDNEALQIGLSNTKELLDKHKHGATKTVFSGFAQQIDAALKAGVEQDLDAKFAHIHDSVLRLLKSKVAEAILEAKAETKNNSNDAVYAQMAIDEARKSVQEDDGKPHPWVGAVVVRDGKVLSAAHRGEVPGNHAEFTALERNLSDVAVAGATVYVTLEPCTTRNRPKIPCADRLIERRIKRVVVGMLDPDDRIRGKGHRKLTNAGVECSFFPHDLAMEVEELNRDFTRFCEQNVRTEVGPVNQELWKEIAGLRTEFAEFKQNVEAREKERAEFENFPANFVLKQGVPNSYVGDLKNDSKYQVRVETIQILRGDVDHESPLTEAVKARPTDDWKVEAGTSKTLYWGPQYEPIGMLKSLVQSSDPNFPSGKVITIALVLTLNVEGKRLPKKYTQQVLMQGNQITPWGP